MKKGYTHLVNILDCSGSVDHIIDDMRGAFNAYLKAQAALESACTVTTVVFNTEVSFIDDFADIKKAHPLTELNYKANGYTALNDAIGITLTSVGKKLAKLAEHERPDQVIVYINTDGFENASKSYDRQAAANLIKHQEDVYKWKFIFAGANLDAQAEAMSYSLSKGVQYVQTSAGINDLTNNITYSVLNARGVDCSISADLVRRFSAKPVEASFLEDYLSN